MRNRNQHLGNGAAASDVPVFVLLGSDPAAYIVVELWAALRSAMGDAPEKIGEAYGCAEQMELWAREHGKDKQVDKALEVFLTIVQSAAAQAGLDNVLTALENYEPKT